MRRSLWMDDTQGMEKGQGIDDVENKVLEILEGREAPESTMRHESSKDQLSVRRST